jgi:hypothetical protein
MEQFNQKKTKAAFQQADRLALENKELEEDFERLLGKYVMEAEARRKDIVHKMFLNMLS